MVISHPISSVSSYLVSLFVQFYLWSYMYIQLHSYWGGSQRKNVNKIHWFNQSDEISFSIISHSTTSFQNETGVEILSIQIFNSLLKRTVLIRSCVRDKLLFNNTLSFSKSCRMAGNV